MRHPGGRQEYVTRAVPRGALAAARRATWPAGRPPGHVIPRLAGGGSALIWRIHHALADGMTAMRMARSG